MSKNEINDEVKKKANERLEDILDTIKIELDTINDTSSIANDVEASQVISNLSDAFHTIYQDLREDN